MLNLKHNFILKSTLEIKYKTIITNVSSCTYILFYLVVYLLVFLSQNRPPSPFHQLSFLFSLLPLSFSSFIFRSFIVTLIPFPFLLLLTFSSHLPLPGPLNSLFSHVLSPSIFAFLPSSFSSFSSLYSLLYTEHLLFLSFTFTLQRKVSICTMCLYLERFVCGKVVS